MNTVLLRLLAPFISNILGSFIRTALAALSGYLINKGISDPEHVNSMITGISDVFPGIGVYLLAQATSLLNKKIP